MKKREREKIAVSGIGGGAGQSILKALYETPYQIVGLDGNPDGTGLYAVPASYQIPYASSKHYINCLKEIFQKEQCRLMFPGLDAELLKLARHREEVLQSTGTIIMVSSPELIEIADDKMKTSELLDRIDLPYPLTYGFDEVVAGSADLQFPFVVKPKTGGARSKNVFKVSDRKKLEGILHSNGIDPAEYVAQEYIKGEEYTCGTVSFEGDCFGVIIMRRILRDGDTYKCFVEFNPVIEEAVRRVIEAVKPFGAMNVQLRMREGKPYIFELNARCSGTTAARAISGFNEPGSVADYLIYGKRPSYQIRKTTIFRYWKELVIEEEQLRDIKKQRFIRNSNFRKL